MRKVSFIIWNVLQCILLASLLEGGPKKPYVKLTAFPLNQMAPIQGGKLVTLWARLLPPEVEVEKYYCPAVRWTLLPDTQYALKAFEEADCPPFEERDEYPRVWAKRYVLGQGEWRVRVELLKGDKVLLLDEITVGLQ